MLLYALLAESVVAQNEAWIDDLRMGRWLAVKWILLWYDAFALQADQYSLQFTLGSFQGFRDRAAAAEYGAPCCTRLIP